MDSRVHVFQTPRRIDQQRDHPPLKRCKRVATIKTSILLPTNYGKDRCEFDTKACEEQNLCLPASSSVPLDKHLSSIPQVRQSARPLLSSPPRRFSRKSRERLLYVSQGEVAHATPRQCDVIASDKATTCHILAFRSTCLQKTPLVSLSHIDWDGYEECIRGIIQEHKAHHYLLSNSNVNEEEKKEDSLVADGKKIDLDIYIMGGFDDGEGSSRTVSDWLVKLLASLAEEESAFIRMTLKTCAISSMNDTGHGRPIGRGMGIDLHTGEAFLAKVDKCVAGPSPELRSARLWAGANERLTVIHTSLSNGISISPFFFRPKRRFIKLLRLSDHQMIQKTSTSPTVEEDDFCDNVRGTFHFMLRINCFDVFGPQCNTPLTFCRVASSNDWVLARRNETNGDNMDS